MITIKQAVAAADPTGDDIVYVDVTAAFADHGIGGTDTFHQSRRQVQTLFTRMPLATLPMPRSSWPNCQTNKRSCSEALRPVT